MVSGYLWKGQGEQRMKKGEWSMYFVQLYENRTMKFVEIVLRE
jgi:hypothetical protein